MVRHFFSYVEIRTKITSIFAFMMAMAYLFYLNVPVRWGLTALFFVSMFLFDMTTTAVNNYIDTKKNGMKLPFSRTAAFLIICILFITSSVLGFLLALQTDLAVFAVGFICFLCGILYTFGPLPLSGLPLGEVFSGVFYGFVIPFLILYVNRGPGTYLSYSLTWEQISLSVMFRPFFSLALLSVAPVCSTANIMLANNICDLERDIEVRRHTLPYYLGNHAKTLFACIYGSIYAAAAVIVIFRVLPVYYLVFLLTTPAVYHNTRLFLKKQEKATTFSLSIKNFLIIMGAHVAMIAVCGLAGRLA